MPLTPFHLGPGLFFGMLTFRFFDLTAFLLGSVILDTEPFFALLSGKLNQPHHYFTSFLGGVLGAVLVLIILSIFKGKIKKWLDRIHLAQASSNLSIFGGALAGCWIHVIFDSFMHYDVSPFWPASFNPFLNLISISQNYFLCLALGIIGLGLLFLKIKKAKQLDIEIN
jgi:uncharacterized membrane protein YeaQ/YmgE (transglycosylase-associated protein family)